MSNPALYLLLCSFVFSLACAENDTAANSVPTDCKAGFRYLHSDRPVNITESCMNGECLAKCCPENQIMMKTYTDGNEICVNSSDLKRDFSFTDSEDYAKTQVYIYGKNVKQEIIKTKKKLSNFTMIFSENFSSGCYFVFDILKYFPEPKNILYLTEDGRLSLRRVNFVEEKRWMEMEPGQFCVEQQVDQDEHGRLVSKDPYIIFRVLSDTDNRRSNDRAKLSVYGMLVSCLFLLLVLLVYSLLEELRNLAGRMLMAYVATLTAAFLARAILVLANERGLLDTLGCGVMGLTYLYLILACFTWMNVMSVDIWSSMRGFRKLRQIHRRGLLVRFRRYCLFAWGVPLVYILFIVIEEHLDLTHLPNFVKSHIIVDPEGCFMDDSEGLLYLNLPILITTFANCVFYFMTAYNIWRIKTAVTQHRDRDSKRNDKEQFRFGLYLKLSVVMGISWILEVMSSMMYPNSSFWYITDAYNVLIGVFIFAVFVCKRKIFVLLCRRFSIQNEYVERWQRQRETYITSTRPSTKKVSVTESSDCSQPLTLSNV